MFQFKKKSVGGFNGFSISIFRDVLDLTGVVIVSFWMRRSTYASCRRDVIVERFGLLLQYQALL